MAGLGGQHPGRRFAGPAVALSAAALAGCALSTPSVNVPSLGRSGPPPAPTSAEAPGEGAADSVLPPATGIGAVEVTNVGAGVGPGSLAIEPALYDQALSTAAAKADAAESAWS